MGAGIPTTATYIILVAVAAPALAQLGIEPLVAHFFVFYYGSVWYVVRSCVLFALFQLFFCDAPFVFFCAVPGAANSKISGVVFSTFREPAR